MKYNYTVHPKSEIETDKELPNKVVATVAMTVDNPEYKEAYDEEVETPVMQYEESGEIKRDEAGEPVYENESQTVHHDAVGFPEKTYVQDIFVTAVKADQDGEVKAYCEQYAKDLAALKES